MILARSILLIATAFFLICFGPRDAVASPGDCQDGTIEVSWDEFFSTKYSGRLAIAPDATTPREAKDADSYCVLVGNFFGSVAKVRKRYDRIYFVFNNRPSISPENAETSFIGIAVKSKSETGDPMVAMRREGNSWYNRPLDRRYRETQFAASGNDVRVIAESYGHTQLASSAPGTVGSLGANGLTSEEAFADRVKATVHGAIKPRSDSPELKKTWDYRDRFTFVGMPLTNIDPPNSVTAVWISFQQKPQGIIQTWRGRIATGVRVGGASEIDVQLFGSNQEIPEYRYKDVYFKRILLLDRHSVAKRLWASRDEAPPPRQPLTAKRPFRSSQLRPCQLGITSNAVLVCATIPLATFVQGLGRVARSPCGRRYGRSWRS
jgi:hypothetical protein